MINNYIHLLKYSHPTKIVSNLHHLFCKSISTSNDSRWDIAEGSLVGVGSSLLDITAQVSEAEAGKFHSRYSLIPGEHHQAAPEHSELFAELLTPGGSFQRPILVPGGATQNSIRVAQWILGRPRATGVIGAVGDDEQALIMRRLVEKSGTMVAYQTIRGKATGCSAAFFIGKNRTLITDLGASHSITARHLQAPQLNEMIDQAALFLVGGYMWSLCPAIVTGIAERVLKGNITGKRKQQLAMNLHTTQMCAHFAEPGQDILPAIDVIYGNWLEALEFARSMALLRPERSVRQRFAEFLNLITVGQDALERIAIYVADLDKARSEQPRTVVFTQGLGPVIACRAGKVVRVAVEPVLSNRILDKRGCGDAFLGGFLASYLARTNDHSVTALEASIRCGLSAASSVIRHYGCNFPTDLPSHIKL